MSFWLSACSLCLQRHLKFTYLDFVIPEYLLCFKSICFFACTLFAFKISFRLEMKTQKCIVHVSSKPWHITLKARGLNFSWTSASILAEFQCIFQYCIIYTWQLGFESEKAPKPLGLKKKLSRRNWFDSFICRDPQLNTDNLCKTHVDWNGITCVTNFVDYSLYHCVTLCTFWQSIEC